MPIYSIPAGVPTQITQNVVYALPARAFVLIADPACEVAQTQTGPWAAPPAQNLQAAAFIRCTTANALVTCKI
jgi:hypothetical protein